MEYTSDEKATLLTRRHADTGVVNIQNENEVKREAEDLHDRGSERRSYQAHRQWFPLEGGARRWSTRQRGTSRGYKSGTLHQVNQVQQGKGVVGTERRYDRIRAVKSRKLFPDFQVRSAENKSACGGNSQVLLTTWKSAGGRLNATRDETERQGGKQHV